MRYYAPYLYGISYICGRRAITFCPARGMGEGTHPLCWYSSHSPNTSKIRQSHCLCNRFMNLHRKHFPFPTIIWVCVCVCVDLCAWWMLQQRIMHNKIYVCFTSVICCYYHTHRVALYGFTIEFESKCIVSFSVFTDFGWRWCYELREFFCRASHSFLYQNNLLTRNWVITMESSMCVCVYLAAGK